MEVDGHYGIRGAILVLHFPFFLYVRLRERKKKSTKRFWQDLKG